MGTRVPWTEEESHNFARTCLLNALFSLSAHTNFDGNIDTSVFHIAYRKIEIAKKKKNNANESYDKKNVSFKKNNSDAVQIGPHSVITCRIRNREEERMIRFVTGFCILRS